MVSSLCQEDAMISHFVHEAMFLSNPPRPDSAAQVSQRFGLPYACKGIPSYSLYQIKNLSGGLMIRGNPVGEIL